jgi:ribosomal 50S subunit-associated protein YjgA (DUF615 family)
MAKRKPKHQQQHRHSNNDDSDDLGASKKVTGKELSEIEELSARLTTLIEMLDERGIINNKEYRRMVAMRLHEISKASAFEEIEEEM